MKKALLALLVLGIVGTNFVGACGGCCKKHDKTEKKCGCAKRCDHKNADCGCCKKHKDKEAAAVKDEAARKAKDGEKKKCGCDIKRCDGYECCHRCLCKKGNEKDEAAREAKKTEKKRCGCGCGCNKNKCGCGCGCNKNK